MPETLDSGEGRPPLVVVMGVSAAGKSSVAAALSRRLDVPWLDADALHPATNVAKMAAGSALDDQDRLPWLDIVGDRLAAAAGGGAGLIIACSALRRTYRDRIRGHAEHAVFVHLSGSPEVLAERAAARVGHFMPASLLASQIATLEPLDADERGLVIDVTPPVDAIVEKAANWVETDD
jgi:gluconokinase